MQDFIDVLTEKYRVECNELLNPGLDGATGVERMEARIELMAELIRYLVKQEINKKD